MREAGLAVRPLRRSNRTVVAPQGDDLILWSSEAVHVLRGHSIGAMVRAILSQIDGNRSAEAIARSLPQVPASRVRELVMDLVEGGILEPAAVNDSGIVDRCEVFRGADGVPAAQPQFAGRDTLSDVGLVALLGDEASTGDLAQALGAVGIATRRLPATVPSLGQVDPALMVALDGNLHQLKRLNPLAVAGQIPLLFAFEHPFRRFVGPLVCGQDGPCLECLRLRLRGAALGDPEAQAVDDAAFSWEGPLLVRGRAPSPAYTVFVSAIVDWILRILGETTGTSTATRSDARRTAPPSVSETVPTDTEVISVDDEGVVRRHRLLAHPSCRSCGNSTVIAASAPELSFPELSSKDLEERPEQFVDPDLGVLLSVESRNIGPDSGGQTQIGQLAQAVGSRSIAPAAASAPLPGGQAFSPSTGEASLKAMMEALERYGLQMDPCGRVVRGSYNQLNPAAMDPRDLVLYSPEQYESAGFPWRAFDPDASLSWAQAARLTDGATNLVPADFVYTFEGTNRLVQSTSSGAAAHTSRCDATLRGLCEVVERDACMLMWYAQLAPPRVEEETLPAQTLTLLAELRAAGYRVSLRYISLDIDIPVVMCVARRFDHQAPALLPGAGCSLDATRAASKATEELFKSYLAYVRYDWAPYIWEDPGPAEAVRQPWQHLSFYARGAYARELDLLDGSESTVTLEELPRSDQGVETDLAQALSLLAARGLEPLAVDYTPRDLRSLGLVLIKVFVPCLQPMHFGERFRRLGGSRLFELPVRLGRASGRLTPADLNPLPHPFP